MASPSSSLRPADLLLFQFGQAGAIRNIVASRWSLPIGVLLVFTAALARNYDRVYLPEHPERFLGPFLVPLISSFLVFLFLYLGGTRKRESTTEDSPDVPEKPPGFFPQYLGYLGAFLLTAPLAWFYAIPVEFLADDLLVAAKWNLFFLALVSLWRVILITRVAQVISGAPFLVLLANVLVPASAEAWVATTLAHIDLVGIMGGVLPPDEEFMARALSATASGAGIVFLVSLVASSLLYHTQRRDHWRESFVSHGHAPPSKVLLVTLLVVVAWGFISLPLQSRLHTRNSLLELTSSQDFDAAIAFLRTRESGDFPTFRPFHPEPRFVSPVVLEAMLKRLEPDDPAWIREGYLELAGIAVGQSATHFRIAEVTTLREIIVESVKLPGGRERLRSSAEEISRLARDSPWGVDEEALQEVFTELREAGVTVPDHGGRESETGPR